MSGAIIGAAISMGIYILQATINNNFSLGGFVKSILLGAATGAVSAGLGEVFSASGFWATVGNGAISGARTGGVTALIMGQNFFEGVLKGAVIGGAVAGISYSINYFVQGNYKSHAFTANNISEDYKYDPTISKEAMQQNINDVQNNLFPEYDPVSNYGVAQNTLGPGNSEGYLAFGEQGQKLLGFASPQKFLSGKTDILYSPISAQYKDLLGLVMVHETGHAYLNMLGLAGVSITRNKWDKEIILNRKYDTTDHFAILKLENHFANKNNLNITKMFGITSRDLNYEFINFSISVKKEINNFYNKLFPIFDRALQ